MENKPTMTDSPIGESIILWQDPRRDGSYAHRQRAIEEIWRWTPEKAFERRLYGLRDRIRRLVHRLVRTSRDF